MKHLPSTILGFIFIAASIAMIFLDMNYSTLEHYSFKLEWWHVSIGILKGAMFIYFEPSEIKSFLSRFINKKIND